MNKKEIGMRMKQLREDRHLHQKEVATILGISQSAYADKENGHTMLSAIEMDKLAGFYEIGLDEFLRAGQPVFNMHDNHSAYGYNVVHAQNYHGVSEELMKEFVGLLAANTKALERLVEMMEKRG